MGLKRVQKRKLNKTANIYDVATREQVCTNYLMTVGFMQAAEEMEMSAPEDFGLASFDDYPWLRCFRPRLTTVELPKYDLGAKSAQLLLERISGKQGRRTIQKLAPQLCVRESCGFTLQLHRSAREAAPRDSQKAKQIEPGARPALVRGKVAGDPEGLTPTTRD